MFEIAARCARAGVPLHAVVGSSTLSAAESAQLSLSSIREAGSVRELEAAGRALAATLDPDAPPAASLEAREPG